MGCGRWRTCVRPGAVELGPFLATTRQRRMPALPPDVRGLRKAGVVPATPQRHSAPQREACFSRPPFFVHCIASALWGARMAQALELRRSRCSAAPAGWQDSRAMHDSRGQCSEKGPSLARSSRCAFPKVDLRRFSDTWRANLAKASSFWIHGDDILPGRGAFPVRGPFRDA